MADRGVPASGASRIGWLIVLAISVLLLVYGVFQYVTGPEVALENISERTTLGPDEFRAGSPSAFDVISIVARQGAAFAAGLGLMAIAVSWLGLRTGSAAAWWAAWAVPLSIAAFGAGFLLVGPGPQGFMFVGLGVVAAAGLLIARRGAVA